MEQCLRSIVRQPLHTYRVLQTLPFKATLMARPDHTCRLLAHHCMAQCCCLYKHSC